MRTLFAVAGALLMLSALPRGQAQAASAGQSCGGFVGAVCDPGLWCDPLPGVCYSPMVVGVCVRAPQICTRIWRPVCGCDGETYGNDCGRQAHRAPKAHDGPC